MLFSFYCCCYIKKVCEISLLCFYASKIVKKGRCRNWLLSILKFNEKHAWMKICFIILFFSSILLIQAFCLKTIEIEFAFVLIAGSKGFFKGWKKFKVKVKVKVVCEWVLLKYYKDINQALQTKWLSKLASFTQQSYTIHFTTVLATNKFNTTKFNCSIKTNNVSECQQSKPYAPLFKNFSLYLWCTTKTQAWHAFWNLNTTTFLVQLLQFANFNKGVVTLCFLVDILSLLCCYNE